MSQSRQMVAKRQSGMQSSSRRKGKAGARPASKPVKPQPAPVEKLLYTVAECGVALGFSRSKTYELVMRGEIPSLKIGQARRVTVQALHAYLDRLSLSA